MCGLSGARGVYARLHVVGELNLGIENAIFITKNSYVLGTLLRTNHVKEYPVKVRICFLSIRCLHM